MQKPNIIFIPVFSNQQKLGSICHYIQHHFEVGDNVLVVAPNEQATRYIDELLWKFSPESFLPHIASNAPSSEKVVITSVAQNLNQALVLINLCAEVSPIAEHFNVVYELYDQTHPEKLAQSQRRQQIYTSKQFTIVHSAALK